MPSTSLEENNIIGAFYPRAPLASLYPTMTDACGAADVVEFWHRREDIVE